MSEQQFSAITIKALMRLYQIELKPNPDGSSSGRLPWSVCSGAKLTLAARGGTWSINGSNPLEANLPVRGTQTYDRLDFIMRMECVTRTRAAELLHGSFPAILKREGIPFDESHRDHFVATASHAATQVDIEETMWSMLDQSVSASLHRDKEAC